MTASVFHVTNLTAGSDNPKQRAAVEADLFEAMRKLRGYSADLAAARQELIALHAEKLLRQELDASDAATAADVARAAATGAGALGRFGGFGSNRGGSPSAESPHHTFGSGAALISPPSAGAGARGASSSFGGAAAAAPGASLSPGALESGWVGKGAPSMMSGVHGLVGVSGRAATGADVTGVGAAGVDVVAMARRRLELSKSPSGSPGGGGGGGSQGVRSSSPGGGGLGSLTESDLGGEDRRSGGGAKTPGSPEINALLKGSEEARARLEVLAGGF
jgi:hypothetical protein